jgi:hypothetical protein
MPCELAVAPSTSQQPGTRMTPIQSLYQQTHSQTCQMWVFRSSKGHPQMSEPRRIKRPCHTTNLCLKHVHTRTTSATTPRYLNVHIWSQGEYLRQARWCQKRRRKCQHRWKWHQVRSARKLKTHTATAIPSETDAQATSDQNPMEQPSPTAMQALNGELHDELEREPSTVITRSSTRCSTTKALQTDDVQTDTVHTTIYTSNMNINTYKLHTSHHTTTPSCSPPIHWSIANQSKLKT